MEVTNKALAFLLVAAIVVSLGGTVVSLNKLNKVGVTGFATANDTGLTNLTINSSIAITFTVANVNFGAGYVNDSETGIENCTIDTNGSAPAPTGTTAGIAGQACLGFEQPAAPFNIRNDGNKDVWITLASNASASDFIGGTNEQFKWFLSDNETGSCTSSNATYWTVWADVSTTNSPACGSTGGSNSTFQYEDGNDLLNLHIRVNIPQDAAPGAREATITAIASD